MATTDDEPDAPQAVEELEELPGGVKLKRKGGRPVYKYNPQYAVVAKAMFRKGATIAELAQVFGVTNSTVWKWRQTYEDFAAAFEELGNAYDDRIERTLAERAAGYTYNAVKIFNYKGIPLTVEYLEHVPPDMSAIKMWLSARRPEKWRIKEEVEFSGDEAFAAIWQQMNKKDEAK